MKSRDNTKLKGKPLEEIKSPGDKKFIWKTKQDKKQQKLQ